MHPSVEELMRRANSVKLKRRTGTMRQMSSLSQLYARYEVVLNRDMMSVGVNAASLNPLEWVCLMNTGLLTFAYSHYTLRHSDSGRLSNQESSFHHATVICHSSCAHHPDHSC